MTFTSALAVIFRALGEQLVSMCFSCSDGSLTLGFHSLQRCSLCMVWAQTPGRDESAYTIYTTQCYLFKVLWMMFTVSYRKWKNQKAVISRTKF